MTEVLFVTVLEILRSNPVNVASAVVVDAEVVVLDKLVLSHKLEGTFRCEDVETCVKKGNLKTMILINI